MCELNIVISNEQTLPDPCPSCHQSTVPRALTLEEMENNCLLLNEEDGEIDRGPQSADSAPPLVLTLGDTGKMPLSLSPYNPKE